jgi:hypothetical protein
MGAAKCIFLHCVICRISNPFLCINGIFCFSSCHIWSDVDLASASNCCRRCRSAIQLKKWSKSGLRYIPGTHLIGARHFTKSGNGVVCCSTRVPHWCHNILMGVVWDIPMPCFFHTSKPIHFVQCRCFFQAYISSRNFVHMIHAIFWGTLTMTTEISPQNADGGRYHFKPSSHAQATSYCTWVYLNPSWP